MANKVHLTIKNIAGEVEPLTLYSKLTRWRGVNGEKRLSFYANPGEIGFDMIEMEATVKHQGIEYIIRQENERNAGQRSIKKVEAVERFFVDMIDSPQPRIHNGSITFFDVLTFVFENTGYSFNIVDQFTAERFENFGRENALSLFQTVLERYGAEYELTGKVVTLRRSRGARTDFAWRYGVNVKVIDKQIDSHDLATAIEGYGGEPDDKGNYPIHETYTSPHADKYPEFPKLKWADPVVNENLSTVTGMRNRLRRVLKDEPQISVTIDFEDLRAAGYEENVPNEGDWGYIIYEPMNDFKAEARIMNIKEEFDNNDKVIKSEVTLSNIRRKLTDAMTQLSRTSKTVERIVTGQQKIPFIAMDNAIINATRALQSAQTELSFENGITAVDKTNSNNLVLLNSAGLGISSDGGASFTTAITGNGVVADAITTGTLRSILIEGVEIRGSTIISDDGTSSFQVQGGRLQMDMSNGRTLTIDQDGIYFRHPDGVMAYQSTTQLTSSYAFGTSDTNVYLAARVESRSVTRDTVIGGGGDIEDYQYLPHRAQGFYGNFLNFNAGTPGTSVYLRPDFDGEIRVTATNTIDRYLDLRSWGIHTTRIDSNGLGTNTGGHPHIHIGATGEVRIASNPGNSDSRGTLRANFIHASALAINGQVAGTHLNLQPNGNTSEVQVKDYTTGDWRDVRAREFINGSSREYKTNIKALGNIGLEETMKLTVCEYDWKNKWEEGIDSKEIGFIAEDSPYLATKDHKAIKSYRAIALNTKAIQELFYKDKSKDEKIEELTKLQKENEKKFATISLRLGGLFK